MRLVIFALALVTGLVLDLRDVLGAIVDQAHDQVQLRVVLEQGLVRTDKALVDGVVVWPIDAAVDLARLVLTERAVGCLSEAAAPALAIYIPDHVVVMRAGAVQQQHMGNGSGMLAEWLSLAGKFGAFPGEIKVNMGWPAAITLIL